MIDNLQNVTNDLFGHYQPIETQVHYVSVDGFDMFYDVIPEGIASLNVDYFASALIVICICFMIYKTIYGSVSSIWNYTRGGK